MSEERVSIYAGVPYNIPRRRLRRSTAPRTALDLHDQDLRGCDLRSLDLEGADLRGADLRSIRTGLCASWRLRLATLSVVTSACMGAVAGLAGHRLHVLITSPTRLERWIGIVASGELLVFLAVALYKGPRTAVRNVLAPAVVGAAVLFMIGTLIGESGAAARAVFAFSLAIFVILTLGTLARVVARATGPTLLVIVALVGAAVSYATHGGATSLVFATAMLLLGRRTYRGDPDLPALTRWSRQLVSAGGTSLRNSDLRGAQLEGCLLLCTDLRGAKLEGAALTGVREVMCALDPAQRSLLAPMDPALAGERDHLRA
ncbi:MAG TPA: pentapeptide repeat-containing protein [Polyangiales bacterium]